jgi:hypothetical protein
MMRNESRGGRSPDSGTVSRRGEGEGKRKYAFEVSEALSTDDTAACLWGRLGMTAECSTFIVEEGASISN